MSWARHSGPYKTHPVHLGTGITPDALPEAPLPFYPVLGLALRLPCIQWLGLSIGWESNPGFGSSIADEEPTTEPPTANQISYILYNIA